MGHASTVGTVLERTAVLLVVVVVAGQAMGQPVLLSYVETGSMSPTLEPGDGFVAVPSQVAGQVEEGDVVVFRAEELHGGGLTTHRVVDITDRGYVTRGDANPFTDQDGTEPPVQEAQVVAVAWRPGGDVFVVPGVGAFVTATQSVLGAVQGVLPRGLLDTQGISYLVFGATLVYYLLSGGSSDGRDRDRSRSRDAGSGPRPILAAFALLIVLTATAAMVVPGGTQKIGVVSAESDAPGPRVVEHGTSETVSYPLANGGFVPAVAYLESPNEEVTVDPSRTTVPARTTVNATVTISAPPETGHYRYFLTERRYLTVLPPPVVHSLRAVHPWLPIVVIDALLGGGFYGAGVAVLGPGRFRSRSRDRDSPSWLDRLGF